MQLKIDHVTLCASKLEPLQSAFAEIGLATDYGGPHANGITHMALLGFADGSYLELIAPYQGQTEASPWAELMLGDAGPGAWAVGTEDIKKEVAQLRAHGIASPGPVPGSRHRPDGKLLEWETASFGPGSAGALLPFLIQDHTPRELRVQPSARVYESAITGVAAVVLGVGNLEGAILLFQRAYGWGAPLIEDHSDFGAQLAHFAGTPVMLASPSGEASPIAQRLAKFGEIPAAFLVKTPDLRNAAHRFPLIGESTVVRSAARMVRSRQTARTAPGTAQVLVHSNASPAQACTSECPTAQTRHPERIFTVDNAKARALNNPTRFPNSEQKIFGVRAEN